MVQQGFTGRRQGHALGLAHEQADAQRLLQFHQAFARRRDCNRFARGGAGQRTLFMHGDEQLQGDQVETADQAFLQHQVLGESAQAKSQHSVLHPRRAVVRSPVVIKSPPTDLLP